MELFPIPLNSAGLPGDQDETGTGKSFFIISLVCINILMLTHR
jgi:hypothetical protein